MEKIPFIVHCGECKHEWPAFYSPMLLDKVSKIMLKIQCPMCWGDPMKIFCGPAPVNTSAERVKNNGGS